MRARRRELCDDIDTPAGRAPVVVEPAGVTVDGHWQIHCWPDVDVPLGTLVALRVPFQARAGQRYLSNGWQSWSAPTVRRLGHAGGPPPLPGFSRRHLFRMADTGDSSYDFLATADAVAGFTSGGGLLLADVTTEVVFAVRRHVGGTHPPVWTARGDGAALVDDLLTRCGGRDPGRLPTSWCTWEAFSARIDADVLTRALGGVRDLAAKGLCELALVDDGWQARIGDWSAHPTGFPAGLAAMADEIRGSGVAAGLWTAPLLLAPACALAQRRPEWVARSADGTPVVGATVGHWGGDVWVLDVTRADVREHLSEVAAAHAAAGFTLFKLDFLYAAASAADAAVERALSRRNGAGAPPTGSGAVPADVLLGADTATAAALDAIRAGAGEGVTLLGCGAPLWPSIGRIDVMRVGPDVTRFLGPRPESISDPEMLAGLRNGWRSAVLRTPMHRRLWGNDPDMVPLSRPTELTDAQRLGWARWVADSGQALSLSDDFADLTGADHAEWRRLVARSRRVPLTPPVRALAAALDDVDPTGGAYLPAPLRAGAAEPFPSDSRAA